MAEGADKSDKTEEPTAKRLEDAHKRGDVARSPEVNTWLVIVAATVAMALLAPGAAGDLTAWLKGLLGNAGSIPIDGDHLEELWTQSGLTIISVLILPFALIVAGGIAGSLIQHRPVFSTEPIRPKASKISPFAGFKRLFSPESLANFVKGLLKLAIVGGAMVLLLWPQVDRLDTLVATDIAQLLPAVLDIAIQLMVVVAAILGVVAGLDFLWQRQRWFNRQRMSLQEIKDEFRQSEGDPVVKAKLAQVRRERGRRRMMTEVPTASVVITNPTHYAVALRYDEGMAAPRCVAKGADAVAVRIRELARRNDVPIVENAPLARSLFAQVDVNATIPESLYRAVAEVIGYVMRLRNERRWRPTA